MPLSASNRHSAPWTLNQINHNNVNMNGYEIYQFMLTSQYVIYIEDVLTLATQ